MLLAPPAGDGAILISSELGFFTVLLHFIMKMAIPLPLPVHCFEHNPLRLLSVKRLGWISYMQTIKIRFSRHVLIGAPCLLFWFSLYSIFMRFGELHRVSLHAYALWLGAKENEESASKVIKSLFGICILSRFCQPPRLAVAATKVKPFLVVTL